MAAPSFSVGTVTVLAWKEKSIWVELTGGTGRPVKEWFPRFAIAHDSMIPADIGFRTTGELRVIAAKLLAKLKLHGFAVDVVPSEEGEDVRPTVFAPGEDPAVALDLLPVTSTMPTWVRPLPALNLPPGTGQSPPQTRAAPVRILAPSAEQARGIGACMRVLGAATAPAVLTGPAGSGKTESMRWLIEAFQAEFPDNNVVLLGPTGRSAARLGAATGRPAMTIHKALYRGISTKQDTDPRTGKPRFRPSFYNPGPPCGPGDLVINDEASMTGRRIFDDLWTAVQRAQGRLCFVGDREQLQPVMDTWGPDFDHPTAVLEVVHRQLEGSPTLALATAIRTGAKYDWGRLDPRVCWFNTPSLWDAAYWLATRCYAEPLCDAVLLAYGNATRRLLNRLVRAFIGLCPLDQGAWTRDHFIVAGDRIVVKKNNYYRDWMNGDIKHVVRVEPDQHDVDTRVVYFAEDAAPARIKLGYIGADQGAFAAQQNLLQRAVFDAMSHSERDAFKQCGFVPAHLEDAMERAQSYTHIDYGWACTVHTVQGSAFREVGYVFDAAAQILSSRRPDEFRRLYYTAITRTSEYLYVWNVTGG